MVVEVLQQTTAPLPESPVELGLSVELQPPPTNSTQIPHEHIPDYDHEHHTTQACVALELLFLVVSNQKR